MYGGYVEVQIPQLLVEVSTNEMKLFDFLLLGSGVYVTRLLCSSSLIVDNS